MHVVLWVNVTPGMMFIVTTGECENYASKIIGIYTVQAWQSIGEG